MHLLAHHAFELQAKKRPDALAVIGGNLRLTYGELDRQANLVANRLRASGVKSDEVVAVLAAPSPRLIVGLLGILKAGGAYLAFDPEFPVDRLEFMFNDCGCRVLLSEDQYAGGWGDRATLVRLDDVAESADSPVATETLAAAECLAYVIYTSGSTGRPKATMLPHRGLVAMIEAHAELFGRATEGRVSQVASASFDAFAFELWPCLSQGGTLCIAGADTRRDPTLMREWLASHAVTFSYQPTAMAEALLEEFERAPGAAEQLAFLAAAGDRLRRRPSAGTKTALYNLYGPTEATVWTTAARIEPAETDARSITIGKAIGQQRVYIMSGPSKLAPTLVPGELCIGGIGLARGYRGRPDLTAEKFVADPFREGARLYRTGDRARRLADGSIEFIGRMDDQVKVRGYRIELGEVEQALRACPGVRTAAVVAQDDAENRTELAGFVTGDPDSSPLDPIEVRTQLAQIIPDYMVPTSIRVLDALPLNASGKIDRRALRSLPREITESTPAFEPPANELEATLARILGKALGRAQVGRREDFFRLGGHSLKAIQVSAGCRKELQVDVRLRDIFAHPTVEALADLIRTRQKQTLSPITIAEPRAWYPVSPAQKRIYVLQQLQRDSVAYNIPAAFTVEGELVASRVESAMQAVIARHEALRTRFAMHDGEVEQRVEEASEFAVEYSEDRQTADADLIRTFVRPFDLEQTCLLRLRLVRRSENRHALLIDLHHIVADLVSVQTLVGDFVRAYQGESLEPLRIQYKDYALWLETRRTQPAWRDHEAFWLGQFAGEPPVLDLATDFPRPAVQSFEGARRRFLLPADCVEGIEAFCAREQVSLFMFLLAAYAVLLRQHSGQQDVVIGTPVVGREHPDVSEIIGMFANTLALRTRPVDDHSFAAFLAEVKELVLGSIERQEYPFDELVNRVEVTRDASRNPLFSTMFVLTNADPAPAIEGLRMQPLEVEFTITKFDLTLSVVKSGSEVTVWIEYATKLFTPETIDVFGRHYEQVIRQAIASPATALGKIDLRNEAEQIAVEREFNRTATPYLASSCLHTLFEEHVRLHGTADAVIDDHGSLTFAELNRRADRLALRLCAAGVASDQPVGLHVRRSAEMLVGMLGILKAGGAFLPLDPDYPADRRSYMLTDSGARWVVADTHDALLANSGCRVLLLADGAESGSEEKENTAVLPVVAPENLAYVIYTSGSSGRPKGVMVQHRSTVNLAAAHQRMFRLPPHGGSAALQFASISFDAAISEIFACILSGNTLIVPSKEARTNETELFALIEKHRIAAATLPPALLETMDPARLTHPCTLISAGESCAPGLAQRWQGKGAFINAYGPTEGTVCATFHVVTPEDYARRIVPIGKPLENLQTYVVDATLRPVPIGVVGELVIAGVGLARGYIKQPALTAERFVANPFADGERMYRTGDDARWRPDGTLEFCGRRDGQVKIRGNRIELDEVEARINECLQPGEQAVVAVRGANASEKRLVAYLATSSAPALELWPSVAEHYIYDDFLYGAMVADRERNAAYELAFAREVKDRIVLDVGTGAEAILARMCIQAGARHVYAIEYLPESHRKAVRLLHRLGLSDKITVILGDARTVSLPEPAEVCVSELVGAIGGAEGVAVILENVRRLLVPGGVMVPRRSLTLIGAISFPDELRENFGFSPTGASYVDRIFEQVGHPFDLRVCIKGLGPEALLTETGPFEDLNFAEGVTPEAEHTISLGVRKSGRVDGFLVWLTLETSTDVWIDILQKQHCWLPVYFPAFEAGVAVEPGDRVEAVCRRTLNTNGLNPDFELVGHIVRPGRANVPFTVESKQYGSGFRRSPFYADLFPNGGKRVSDASAGAVRLDAVKRALEAKLPAHMVPTAWVTLDKLPLTTNGKVDRKALPEPETNRSAEAYVAPRTDAQKALAEIFEHVLGVRDIGLADSFFQLGGDSIKAIQIAARARTAGYLVSVAEVFRYPTIDQLAERVQRLSGESATEPTVEGDAPATPIQRWFLEATHAQRSHWNQAVVLQRAQGYDAAHVTAALKALVDHHDALGAVLSGSTLHYLKPVDRRVVVDRFEVEGADWREGFAAAATQVQASLDLEHGPLIKAAIGATPAGDFLLVVVHHLVVDGVSARILLEDLETAYAQVERGEPVKLPARTHSFQRWAQRLATYAQSLELRGQYPYWKDICGRTCASLPGEPRRAKERERRTISVSLDASYSRALLGAVHRAYGTEINDVLLCALGRALMPLTDGGATRVFLEGHGREEIFPDLNVTRTVGWFTSLYPIILDTSRNDPGAQLRRTKERLRAVPEKGIGYGLLRYLTALSPEERAAMVTPMEVSFNYLGQLGGASVAPVSSGRATSPENEAPSALAIDALMAGDRLQINLTFDAVRFAAAAIETLADDYLAELKSLIAHCAAQPDRVFTASDLGDLTLREEDVAHLWQPEKIERVSLGSPLQQGIFFHHEFEAESRAHVVQLALDLEGDFDHEAFAFSLNQLAARHEALRSNFVSFEGTGFRQVIYREKPAALAWRSDSDEAWLDHEFAHRFDLEHGELWRIAIAPRGPGRHRLALTWHHLILDGWSVPIVLQELFTLYQARRQGVEAKLEAPWSLATYTRWLATRDLAQARAHWTSYLEGSAPREYPWSGYRGKEYQLEELLWETSAGLTRQIQELGAQRGVTLSTIFQVAWAAVLQRYQESSDVAFGHVISGRSGEWAGVERAVGLFINTLPVRFQAGDGETIARVLARHQQEALLNETHGFIGLPEIQACAHLDRGTIDHLFTFENYPIERTAETLAAATGTLRILPVHGRERSNYPVNVVVGSGETLIVKLRYNAHALDAAAAERLLAHYRRALEQIVARPESTLRDLVLLEPTEEQTALAPRVVHSGELPCVHALFEAQVALRPEATALIFGTQRITYRELNDKANQLARKLRTLGVGPERTVALLLEWSVDTVVAIFAVMKAGGAYVPIDLRYPVERMEYMFADSDCTAVITQRIHHSRCQSDRPTIFIDDEGVFTGEVSNLEVPVSPENLLYVIYTSGSTGRPKGTLIEHRHVSRLLSQTEAWFGFGPSDVWTLFHSYAFDFSVWELFGSLGYGGSLVVVPFAISRDPQRFWQLLNEENVTVLNQTPSAFKELISVATTQPRNPSLRYVIFGGEMLQPASLHDWFQHYASGGPALINMYGITETTVHVTYHPLHPRESEGSGRSVIGVPIPDLSVYVRGRTGQLAPSGVIAQMFVGGAGVARGYLGRPDLTAQRFIADPAGDGERLYCTGDLARRLSDGGLEFLGRADDQVKIRGHRIELGEIEAAMRSHRGVARSVALARDTASGKAICGYYVENDFGCEPIALREHLATRLPDYMIPAYLTKIERLALTANGKIDKHALPAPDATQMRREFVGANDHTELRLSEAFAFALGLPQVGIDDDFFELGGDSIKAIQLAARAKRQLGVSFELKDLFQAGTVRRLARTIRETQPAADPLLMHPGRTSYPVSATQRRMYISQELDAGVAYNITAGYLIEGAFDRIRFEAAVDAVFQTHSGLRTRFAMRAGELTQEIVPTVTGAVRFERSDAPWRELMRAFVRPFDLTQAPLCRFLLVERGASEHLLFLDLHHAIADLIAIQVLLRDLLRAYAGEPLAAPVATYGDYALWETDWLASSEMKSELAFWTRQLSGAPAFLDLPTDYPRGSSQKPDSAAHAFALDASLVDPLKQLARTTGVTLFMVLSAAYKSLLYQYTGATDLVVGSAIANRVMPEVSEVVGPFVNTLALRTDLSGDPTFTELLRREQAVALEAYAHQRVPFDAVLDAVAPNRDRQATPLFQTMLLLQPEQRFEALPAGATLRSLERAAEIGARTDVDLYLYEGDRLVRGIFVYNAALFSPATIERLSARFGQLLERAVANPSLSLSTLAVDPEVELPAIDSLV